MNEERRKFIKTACFCGVFLLAGKVIGSVFPSMLKNENHNDQEKLPSSKRKASGNGSAFYDDNGNKVLIIEK